MKLQNIILATAFLILVIWAYKCSGCNASYPNNAVHDTVWLHVHDSTEVYQPQVDFIEGGHIPEHVDTARVITKYYERPVYIDTVRTKYGIVRITDTLTQNRIIARQVFTDFNIPVVAKVPKPRNQVFLGAGAMYGPGLSPAVGPSIMFKSKRGQALELGGLVNMKGQWMATASLKVLIHLKK